MIIVNPLFEVGWGGGGLIETWGLFERQGAYLI